MIDAAVSKAIEAEVRPQDNEARPLDKSAFPKICLVSAQFLIGQPTDTSELQAASRYPLLKEYLHSVYTVLLKCLLFRRE